ncbi:reversion-inducing cysteine-rich protein with Kazal motifs isoform X1 [Diprion similis]|uniref:reversion-inducing cysteine-rich protein with Kazal motifs isoform X1 n=1 Tax=Diprion similis TaxID=362088 RepID=UPI001EF99A68|nr:reversion-inducing cysteine-rich protein with Kazal motifs isoform X1 [Diprion similis]
MTPRFGSCLTLLVVLYAGSALSDAGQEILCCHLAAGSCRSVCSKIRLVEIGADPKIREEASRNLSELCSVELTEFWDCFNSTVEKARKNENWVGRGCCHLSQNFICGMKCALAGSRSDLDADCRQSDELELFSCMEKQEESERCCNNVTNETCRAVCRTAFHNPGKHSSRKLSENNCQNQMPKCLKTIAEAESAENPKQYLHCCDEATSTECLESCRSTLRTAVTNQDIFDTLEKKCGLALPHSPIWSCIMKTTTAPEPPRLPLDAAKLSCCYRAYTSNCKKLCWRVFQADWESAWSKLDNECLSSPMEGELRRCLDDSDDPCEPGCSGLRYCSRYNDRPTTLFRTCSVTADNAAQWEADHWVRGGVITGLGLPVRAAPSCPVETLRAAACLFQLRPCESRIHETRLCRDDCLELLSGCVDWSAITGPHTAATLCAKLSPPRKEMPCVSLKPYLEDSPEFGVTLLPDEDITTPCLPNPCLPNQVCILHPNAAKGHQCVASCLLGEISKQMVPLGTWVQVPRADQQGCLKICKCTLHGLEKCRELNCFSFNSCWVQDRFVTHRSNFYLECNPCTCFEGEITCSRKSCGNFKAASLPCDCPAHYVPVCGRLGVTFASACLAKCSGVRMNKIEFGSCSSRDPCDPDPCDSTAKCVRRPRVCLSIIHKPCAQHECVSLDCDLRHDTNGPVCDKDNREHASLCALIRAGATLGYRGPCLQGCSLRGPVCGINGEVYPNECSAWGAGTSVDYVGPCIAVGLVGDVAKQRCGEIVQCPPLAAPNCIGVTPPGACCPVCGGAARLFYSRKQLERILHMMDEEMDRDAVTLGAMLVALGRQIQVSQCMLRGALTPEGDIFVINQPLPAKPSPLQLQACIAEIEKLVTRISERSPRILAEVPLGSLTRAEIMHGHVSGASSNQLWIAMLSLAVMLLVGF